MPRGGHVMRIGSGRGGVVLLVAVAVLLPLQSASEAPGPPAAVPASASGPAPAPLRIMPLGASSTVGTGSAATAGYRGPLLGLLARDGVAVDLVGSQRDGSASVPDRDHEGHGGWTLARLQPFVGDWVRAHRPAVVLLHAGTNDLLEGASGAVAARRLERVLDALHAASPTAHVVVAGVWAPLPGAAAARAELARLTAALVAGRQARGHPISYVETATLLAPADFTDSLHANAAGYRRIAAMWHRAIRPVIRS
jgi:acyl-CoA thioesterase-1